MNAAGRLRRTGITSISIVVDDAIVPAAGGNTIPDYRTGGHDLDRTAT